MPLALIVVATVLAHSAFNGSRLTISLNALALGASPLVVGTMMSLFAALPMVLAVPAGRMVDRIGVRRPLIATTAILALAIVLPGLLPGIATLYVAAVLVGTSFMVFHIAVQHAVGQGSTALNRMDNFSWLALGFSISNFIGPTMAGLAIDNLGFTYTFLLLAVFAATAFAVLAARRKLFAHTPPRPPEGPRGSTLGLLHERPLRHVFIVSGLLASAWDMFAFVMPIYGTAIGLSASTIGFILGSFAAATFLVRLFLPWIQRYVREWTMITGALGIACVAYALYPLMHTAVLLSITSFLLGLGLGATQPSVMSLLYSKAPPGRAGEAVGVRSLVLNVSSTVLPLAFGGMASLSMTPVFLTMSGALAAGAAFSNRIRRTEAG